MSIQYLDISGNNLSGRFENGSGGELTGYLDSSGNDLNTRFQPYTGGAIGSLTGYLDLNGNDLNTRFSPLIPQFPSLRSGVLTPYVCIDVDGSNCVVSGQNGTYLYWSDNFCQTINVATIGGVSNQTFFGCVAISGANAIAMGRLTSGGANTFFLSTDYGKTYSAGTGVTGGGASNLYGMIAMSGSNAVWTVGGLIYYSTNSGLTWTSSGTSVNTVHIKMYGDHVYSCSTTQGFHYSINGGRTFTKNSSVPNAINSVTRVPGETTLYIGGLKVLYRLTAYNSSRTNLTLPTAMPTNTYIISMASFKTSTNTDFVMLGCDNAVIYYSNTAQVSSASSFQPMPTVAGVTISGVFSLFVNRTRITAGLLSGTSNLYWGKNTYIT
jgi:hypothetical protein